MCLDKNIVCLNNQQKLDLFNLIMNDLDSVVNNLNNLNTCELEYFWKIVKKFKLECLFQVNKKKCLR
uniref:Uncharacterized protein n=1 Tax=Sweet potato vein clearing virus TaxID=995049 RepID=A0A2R4VAC4_9VIRU|nr:hypothetical protein [Sweet potato vein clearing virus]